MATIEIEVNSVIETMLHSMVDQVVSQKMKEKFAELKAENERLAKRGWWDDEEIGDYFGKSKLETQRLLRLMAKDPVASRYISKTGGRSTRADVFEKWLMHHEMTKYNRSQKQFEL